MSLKRWLLSPRRRNAHDLWNLDERCNTDQVRDGVRVARVPAGYSRCAWCSRRGRAQKGRPRQQPGRM